MEKEGVNDERNTYDLVKDADGQNARKRIADFENVLLQEVHRWEGTRFLFRGYTPRGADCVGGIVGFMRRCGIPLPDDDGGLYEPHWFAHDGKLNRYLDGWLKFGRIVSGLGSDMTAIADPIPVAPGDVVCFWDFRLKKVTHSGLMLKPPRFFHSHAHYGGVKIHSLEDKPFVRFKKTFIRLHAVVERVDVPMPRGES